jgi:glycosyltransferase involved in cell wall biosynthesis
MNSAGGGAALSTLGLVGELGRQGVESCAVCHESATEEEREQLRDAVHGQVLVTRLYWWNRKIRAPWWTRPLMEAKQIWRTGWAHGSAARVAECAARWGADLVHTNTIVTPEGGMAARRLGLPHVWHLRELVGPGHPFRLRREGPALGRYLAAHCSKLVANSNTTAQLVRDWLPNGLLEVVPNGIDLARFEPRRGQRDGKRIVVGMVGNLTARWKRHDLFVEAAARVDRRLPIEWRIYGHGQPRGDSSSSDAYVEKLVARIAQAGLADRFCWPGFVADPAQIMSQVDLVVHPTDQESFGRVVVEAMAAGLPVVGVRGGGVAEIIELRAGHRRAKARRNALLFGRLCRGHLARLRGGDGTPLAAIRKPSKNRTDRRALTSPK